MKKTLTINISGTIFNIDDDAYEKLNSYIDSLRRHFKNQEGSEEILEDIEIRISELLSEKIQEQKQVITINDIESIITILGQPSDFMDDDDDESTDKQSAFYESKSYKRLYRDPDNQILGGVCGGLGAYFRVDPMWFRVFFIILTLVGGSGILIYFILWLALPKALTTAEKLEMRGEKVTISNIEKSIKDEFGNIRDKINDITSSTKQSYKKKEPQVQNAAESLLDIFLTIIKVFVRILLIIIGVSLLIAGIAILASFLGLIFGWHGFFMMEGPDMIDISINSVFSLIFPYNGAIGLYKLGFILFLTIPFLMIIYNAIRLIFKMDRIKYIGLAALNLWIFGLIITIIFSFKTVREFKYGTTISEEIKIETPLSNKVYLNIQDFNDYNLMAEGIEIFQVDEKELFITDDGKFFNNVWFEIEDSDDEFMHIYLHTFSRGKNPPNAKANAGLAQYPISVKDSLFTFNKFYKLDNESPWRGQKIKIEIKVPKNKEIIIEEEFEDFMRYNNYNYDWEDWDEWNESHRNYWRSGFFQNDNSIEEFSLIRACL